MDKYNKSILKNKKFIRNQKLDFHKNLKSESNLKQTISLIIIVKKNSKIKFAHYNLKEPNSDDHRFSRNFKPRSP